MQLAKLMFASVALVVVASCALHEPPREGEPRAKIPQPTAPTVAAPLPQPSGPNKIGDTITNSIGMKLTYIPAGEFVMGSPADEVDRSDEEVLHRVKLTKPCLMGVTEVTQGQWQAVMGNNPSHFKGRDDLPVEQVSWDDAMAFCMKLSEKEGKTYRLPTEAQWEYAARAGTTVAYPGSQSLGDVAWYGNNSGGTSHVVATKAPNPWGLYDMQGNVTEWCSDWYGAYPSGEQTDPTGPLRGTSRVVRRGSWAEGRPGGCRIAFRTGRSPLANGGDFGLRVVSAVPASDGPGEGRAPSRARVEDFESGDLAAWQISNTGGAEYVSASVGTYAALPGRSLRLTVNSQSNWGNGISLRQPSIAPSGPVTYTFDMYSEDDRERASSWRLEDSDGNVIVGMGVNSWGSADPTPLVTYMQNGKRVLDRAHKLTQTGVHHFTVEHDPIANRATYTVHGPDGQLLYTYADIPVLPKPIQVCVLDAGAGQTSQRTYYFDNVSGVDGK